MKAMLRRLFAPILDHFESGEERYAYKQSHRQILVIVAALFLTLAIFGAFISIVASQAVGLLPALIFFGAGAVCGIVGLLGSDKAVANIWKSK